MVARETATCSRRHFGDESFFTLSHFAAEMLAARDDTLEGKTCLISGSGNVAQHTAEKIIELGGKVLTLSDSSGYIYDPEGIDSKKLLFAPAKAANAGVSDVDSNGDGTSDCIDQFALSEIIGTWGSGIWYWDATTSAFTLMTTLTGATDIAAGDFNADGIADVASSWTSGLWYQDGSTLAWTPIIDLPPNRVTAGDVTGE